MFFLNPRLASDVFDGEYIIANLDTGLYYSVQGLAVSFIDALPFDDENQLINVCSDAFPESGSVIKQELRSVLTELLKEEIILQNNENASSEKSFTPPADYIPSQFNRYADMQDLLMLDPIHDVDEEGWMVQNTDDESEIKEETH